MGLFGLLFPSHVPAQDAPGHILRVPSGSNVRELGGYAAQGATTVAHRFLRSGSTEYLGRQGVKFLRNYGVTHVLDLRAAAESPERTCALAHAEGIVWKNVSLYTHDISDPLLMPEGDSHNYLLKSYLAMLGNRDAVRESLAFLASVPSDSCVLFHCAAGMDRTGIVSLLLLGLVGVRRTQLLEDYLYSFGEPKAVDEAVERDIYEDGFEGDHLRMRYETMAEVCDILARSYGDVESYLRTCDLTEPDLERLRDRLLTP